MEQCGMDTVFTIYTAPGELIKMFKEMGKLSKQMVNDWIQDLTVAGCFSSDPAILG